MDSREQVNLSDVLQKKGYIRGPFGSALKRGDMKETGIPVYEQQHAIYNHRNFRYFIDDEKFNEMQRFQVQTNDLIISCSGTVGKVSIINEEDPKGIISQALLLLRANTDKILPEYLRYFFTSSEGYNAIVSRSSGSVQVNISKRNVIEQIPLSLPTLATQKKIVDILGDIDKKIKTNEMINENLEQQAQALYSAWFESYVPFGGKMPADWNTGLLADVAKISTKSFNPAKNPGIKLEHYSIPAFDEKKFPVFETSDDIKSNKYILSSISVLASKLNPDTKRIWRPMYLTDNAVCSTEFIVFESANTEWKDFVYSIINSNNFSNWMCVHTTGSTNSRQRTTPAKTLEFEIVIPPKNVIMDFCSTITPMYDLIAENRKENHRLEKLRDTLLPKLMSGEINVSDLDI